MGERKCEWCGAEGGLLPRADECVDSTDCANRILEREKDAIAQELATLRAQNTRLREALDVCADTLEQVRTGEDFEVECWNVAVAARRALEEG